MINCEVLKNALGLHFKMFCKSGIVKTFKLKQFHLTN